MEDLKIISAEITAMPRPMPEGMLDPMPKVLATFEDGGVEELFEYYPDELSFTCKEFVGLTLAQGKSLKSKKDKDFLQS